MENKYLSTFDYEDKIIISFYIENQPVFDIGEKMTAIDENAYMNGYNWEAFLNHYFGLNNPSLLEGLDADPEAGTYSAMYKLNEENRGKSQEFINVVTSLIENPELLYSHLKKHREKIEWD